MSTRNTNGINPVASTGKARMLGWAHQKRKLLHLSRHAILKEKQAEVQNYQLPKNSRRIFKNTRKMKYRKQNLK
jgi:hypothetical protein